MDEIEIVTLPPSSWEAYKNIRLEALKEEPQAFGQTYEEVLKDPDEHWKEILQNAEKEDKDILYFAKVNGIIVGILGAFFQKSPETQDTGIIYGTYVTKAYRSRGIGKLLLQRVLERLSLIPDIKKARLSVSKTEEPAKTLYTKLGFRVVGDMSRNLGDGMTHQIEIMEKEL